MERIKGRKNIILCAASLMFLLFSGAVYSNAYQKLPFLDHKTITIGVFSDSYWEVQNGYSYRILDDAIAEFEKQHPNVKVEYVSGILKEDYSEWLAEQLLSDRAPDLFFVLPEDFNDLAELGALKDLTQITVRDETFDEERFFSSAYQYGQYNEVQYALPYECAPKLMFVNKTILDKERIPLPDREWTWDMFYQICETVTKDTNGNGVLDQFGYVNYTWEEAFESNGVVLFDQKGTRCYLSDDKAEAALVFMEKLQALNREYHVTTKEFDLGNVVFQPMSFSEYRAYKPYPLSIKKYSGFEWECIPMPAGPDGDNISTLDTLLVAMNEKTQNAQYAWDLMKTLTYDVQIQNEIFDYSEGVSVLREVTESEEALQVLMESSGAGSSLNLQILSDAVENAVVTGRFRNYAAAVAEVDRAVHSIIEGNANIHMEQIIWNRKINKFLDS